VTDHWSHSEVRQGSDTPSFSVYAYGRVDVSSRMMRECFRHPTCIRRRTSLSWEVEQVPPQTLAHMSGNTYETFSLRYKSRFVAARELVEPSSSPNHAHFIATKAVNMSNPSCESMSCHTILRPNSPGRLNGAVLPRKDSGTREN
jgi:hypothetical protein